MMSVSKEDTSYGALESIKNEVEVFTPPLISMLNSRRDVTHNEGRDVITLTLSKTCSKPCELITRVSSIKEEIAIVRVTVFCVERVNAKFQMRDILCIETPRHELCILLLS
jgi:hypothetical protein